MKRLILYWVRAAGTAFLPGFTTSTLAASSTTAGFDGGSNDGFTGNAFFEATGGNPGGLARYAKRITELLA